jgi:F-type H+-transporting ATPase subunit a
VAEVFGVEVWITETIFNTWIVMGFLILAALVIRIVLGRFKEIPSGLQNFIEVVVEFINNLVKSAAGEKLAWLGHWFFAVILFIIGANFSGMLGLRPPTADWATTFALAMGTFILIQVMGVKYNRGKYNIALFTHALSYAFYRPRTPALGF